MKLRWTICPTVLYGSPLMWIKTCRSRGYRPRPAPQDPGSRIECWSGIQLLCQTSNKNQTSPKNRFTSVWKRQRSPVGRGRMRWVKEIESPPWQRLRAREWKPLPIGFIENCGNQKNRCTKFKIWNLAKKRKLKMSDFLVYQLVSTIFIRNSNFDEKQ
jgi:hypothetical protein